VLLLAVAPLSISGAAKNRSAMHLPGYRAVRVHYGPMNKMIMSVRINGHPAKLLVDTGSNQLILDAEAAELFGVTHRLVVCSTSGPRRFRANHCRLALCRTCPLAA